MLMFLLGFTVSIVFLCCFVVVMCIVGTRGIPKDFPSRQESPTQKVKVSREQRVEMLKKSAIN